jgi:hypothetical protein
MSDDAHFHLSGYANKQNRQSWSNKKPGHTFNNYLYRLKVTISCGVPAFGINGPYFLEKGNRMVTVNSMRHQAVLETELDADNVDGELWFQQVSATKNRAHEPTHCLRPMFPGYILFITFNPIHQNSNLEIITFSGAICAYTYTAYVQNLIHVL